MAVARRAGTGADLAALLPENDFGAADVDVLEKQKLPSLAATHRAFRLCRLPPFPDLYAEIIYRRICRIPLLCCNG